MMLRRQLPALLLTAGAACAVIGLTGAISEHPAAFHPVAEAAPSTTTMTLTAGSWSLYGQQGTGPYGSPIPVSATVTAPSGGHFAVAAPTSVDRVTTGGLHFAEAVTFRVPSTGPYQVAVITAYGDPLRVLLAPSRHPTFPWVALAIDGAVLLATGSALTAVDRRRRHHDALDALAAAAAAAPPSAAT